MENEHSGGVSAPLYIHRERAAEYKFDSDPRLNPQSQSAVNDYSTRSNGTLTRYQLVQLRFLVTAATTVNLFQNYAEINAYWGDVLLNFDIIDGWLLIGDDREDDWIEMCTYLASWCFVPFLYHCFLTTAGVYFVVLCGWNLKEVYDVWLWFVSSTSGFFV